MERKISPGEYVRLLVIGLLVMGSVFFIALLLISCEANSSIEKKYTPVTVSDAQSIKAKIFLSEFGGYGYDILVNDTVFIHQPHIPVLNDNLGFPTEERARQVAALVIAKIRNREIPPSVTRDELIKFYLSE